MKLKSSKGFTMVELLLVVCIISVLTSSFVGTAKSITNKANTTTDINNAEFCNTMLNMMATSDETIQQWASISDETHVITWNESGKRGGVPESGMMLEDLMNMDINDLTGMDLTELTGFDMSELSSMNIDELLNMDVSELTGIDMESMLGDIDLSSYNWEALFSDVLSLPVSQTGDGFMMIVNRDGNGFADFHTYAMCDLSQADLEALRREFNIGEEYWSIINGKGGK